MTRTKYVDEPVMSDQTLLVSVEDLIHRAFGSMEKNTVNFKLIQTILHILARQLRLLEQDVEIKFDEIGVLQAQQADDADDYDQSTSSSLEDQEGVRGATERDSAREKKERAKKEGKRKKKERDEKGAREPNGEREEKSGRGEKGEKKEKRGKGEKEDGGRGKTSSKDRDGKGGSKDIDGKSREDRKSKDREIPGRSPRGRKGDDDRHEGEERRGGRDRGSRHDDRKGSSERGAGKQESRTSITVTEATRRGGKGGSDKILVAERGPASPLRGKVHAFFLRNEVPTVKKGARPARVGSIEVVTASQFALLERAVKQLQQVSGPPPVPALPDNEQLRKDLAKGRASLTETMQAVQLNARVQAAEQGLARMAELLTQLAMAGALPLDLASRIGQMQAELNQAAGAGAAGPAGAEAPGSAGAEAPGSASAATARFADTEHGGGGAGRHGAGRVDQGGRSTKTITDPSTKRSSVGSAGAAGAPGPAELQPPPPGVTHQEMHEVLEYMKEAITKEIQTLTARANHYVDMALNMSKSVVEKLDVALQIDKRITTLFSQTDDYAQQLSGFDSGLAKQMTSFQEQMTQMRKELKGGLTLLESVNNNVQTAAIIDLSGRYEGLVIELDNTVHMHHALAGLQQQLSDELRSLVECVEMLREQKADRDEVLDGLRDKADISRLAGLLYEKDFAQARCEIEKRLAKCYEKFHKQDQVWQTALTDLSLVSDNKADIITLMVLKEEATEQLNNIQEQLRKLEIVLGEPKAALLMRQLAAHAACGACLARAVMPPQDAAHGRPRALPPLRPAPPGAADCRGEVKLSPPDNRDHTCQRWVGGSHTLMGGHVAREKADEMDLQAMPTKKFEGYGTDGRLYMMEEDLQPCAECNKLSTEEPGHVPSPTGAGGDQA